MCDRGRRRRWYESDAQPPVLRLPTTGPDFALVEIPGDRAVWGQGQVHRLGIGGSRFCTEIHDPGTGQGRRRGFDRLQGHCCQKYRQHRSPPCDGNRSHGRGGWSKGKRSCLINRDERPFTRGCTRCPPRARRCPYRQDHCGARRCGDDGACADRSGRWLRRSPRKPAAVALDPVTIRIGANDGFTRVEFAGVVGSRSRVRREGQHRHRADRLHRRARRQPPEGRSACGRREGRDPRRSANATEIVLTLAEGADARTGHRRRGGLAEPLCPRARLRRPRRPQTIAADTVVPVSTESTAQTTVAAVPVAQRRSGPPSSGAARRSGSCSTPPPGWTWRGPRIPDRPVRRAGRSGPTIRSCAFPQRQAWPYRPQARARAGP